MMTKTMITCEEFEKLALTGKLSPWCELIDGEIVEMAPPECLHSVASSQVHGILRDFVRPKKLGYVLCGETGLHIRSDLPRCRGADVLFISYKRLPKGNIPQGFLRVPPELIVDILSDTWSVMDEKVDDYHRTGVDMVWVVDPKTRTVKKFPRGGKPAVIHDGGEIDGGKILPGFKVPVSRIFDED